MNFMDYRGVRAAFADAAAWWRPEVNLSEPGTEPVRVSTIETSANLFELLGVADRSSARAFRRTARSTRAIGSPSSAIGSGASATTPTPASSGVSST